ncbi:hypothetical protein B0H67DRAFT_684091 [Lasiosphaeris hirsuta]|uniref:Peptidase A1 domain-containing protein n=1 Tax=Lasiosphaeris hirsuta TaxID=260670 RepID=A0AA40AHK6_9PEZI|nr:hypothetical protein B0H67DRAFT_684091 [Lasiosphaeris hirsuta]
MVRGQPFNSVTVRLRRPSTPTPEASFTRCFSPRLYGTQESLPTCHAKSAGMYDARRSTSAFNVSAAGLAGTVRNEAFHGTWTLHGDASFIIDDLTLDSTGGAAAAAVISNATILAAPRAFRTLPEGRTYSPTVWNMALGALDKAMIFGKTQGFIAPGTLPIGLVDISIGIADAAADSPFPFRPKPGLLAQGNSSLSPSLNAAIEPLEPHLYLPDSTCRAIAAELPVSFSADLGLYLWDTANPRYLEIMSSPTAHLAFTFRARALGPLLSAPVVRSIQPSDGSVVASADSWIGTWVAGGVASSPDAANPNTSSSSAPSSSNGKADQTGVNVVYIAGAVAGGVGALVVGVVVWWPCRRRRQKRQSQADDSQTAKAAGVVEDEKPWTEVKHESKMEQYAVGEMAALASPRMLDSKTVSKCHRNTGAVELP